MSWIDTKQLALVLYNDYHVQKGKLSPNQYASLDTMFGDDVILAKKGKEVLAEFKRLLHREEELKELGRSHGQVTYKGTILPLTDKPRARPREDGSVEFFATAVDIANNRYNVTWKCLEGFDAEEADGNYEEGIDWSSALVKSCNQKGMSEDGLLSGVSDWDMNEFL